MPVRPRTLRFYDSGHFDLKTAGPSRAAHSSFFVLLSINSGAAKFQGAGEFLALLSSDLVSESSVPRTFAVTILPMAI